MAQARLSPFRLRSLAIIFAASVTLTLPVPGVAEEMRGDRGGGGFGTSFGIGVGIGIANELIRQQGTRPDAGKSPAKPNGAAQKADTKKAKRAANAPKPQATELKPPTTQTPDKPPPTPATDTPPTQKTDNPPKVTANPPNQPTANTPQNQPQTPTANNQPNQPPAQPPPPEDKNKTAHGHLSACPQLGMGCAALIIDFRANVRDEGSHLEELVKSLKSISCLVDYVAPKFTPQTENDDAKQMNNAQMQSIKNAIKSHRAKVAAGKELAIEIVQGHGGGTNEFPEGSFGVFGSHDMDTATYGITVRADRDRNAPKFGRAGMSRGLFHAGNYEAANKRVCRWFVWDETCFSGDTPRAVDTLNNTGTANYTSAPANVCPLHAAYSLDLAIGSSTDATSCHFDNDNKSVDKLVAEIGKFHAEQIKEQHLDDNPDEVVPTGYRGLNLDVVLKDEGEDKRSLYDDGGYRYCLGPNRDGYKFTPDPNPVRADE